MLTELHVAGLGIVADLTIVLEPGLTAITGETGAGKTLLVEALELVVGGRADPSMVRDGAEEARVEARFVEVGSGRESVLARVVPAVGRSRGYVDGRLATAGELAEVGAALVDLHGQHVHQSLLSPSVQCGALDAFAGAAVAAPLERYRRARVDERSATDELRAFGGDEHTRAREVDLLRFQVSEIDTASVQGSGETLALEAEEALLADAVAHRDALQDVLTAVDGPAIDATGAAIAALAGRPSFAAIRDRLSGVQSELADLAHEVRLAREAVVLDPARLEAVRARRTLLRDLCRKYGDTLDDVIAFGRTAASRLAELEGYEERAGVLEARRRAAATAALAAAVEVTAARRAASAPLADAVTSHLHDLAMPAARLEVRVEPCEPGADGADRVALLLAANPGEPARPLSRAASGGELARAMLAARVVLSGAPPTLVFDEVDAGIGGEAGTAVGRLLAGLAGTHQVLCVTHLAQVAANADAQIVVEKQEEGDRTVAVARPVTGDERLRELSRMLAGLGESAHARGHAAELLDRAASGRER